MKLKVCGMKYVDNIALLAQLPIDYIGFIFYDKSPRYVHHLDTLDLPKHIKRVGVFVNQDLASILWKVLKYKLDVIQLHGAETAELCQDIRKQSPDTLIIKAFSIASADDLINIVDFNGVCDYYLFDTKTSGYGGSGEKFDWKLLHNYKGDTPFLLSGGISVEDAVVIKNINHPMLYGLDLNSRFEIEAGLKNIPLLETFIKELKI